jgi:hypothetical protein
VKPRPPETNVELAWRIVVVQIAGVLLVSLPLARWAFGESWANSIITGAVCGTGLGLTFYFQSRR